MELPLQPCMANMGILFSFPFDKERGKINVQFNISQMIIGEDLSEYTLDNESFNGQYQYTVTITSRVYKSWKDTQECIQKMLESVLDNMLYVIEMSLKQNPYIHMM